MAQVKPKVIFVGDQRIGNFFEVRKTEWDFAAYAENIMSVWTGLKSGKIDNQSQVILISDQFFDPSGQDDSLEQLVAAMAPYCFIGIVNYNEAQREEIRSRIEGRQAALSATDAKFYFIQKKNPINSLNISIKDYIKTSGNENVIAILEGREVVQEEVPEEPEEDYTQKYNNIDEAASKYLGQVVAVTSSKGGSGKSTVGIMLGTYLAHSSVNSVKEGKAERPLKVCILDLDVRDGQIGFLTNLSSPTVINLRLKGISQESIEETVIHSPRLKLDLLLAPKRPRHSDETPPDFYVELIHNLRRMYDYVILDTSVNYLDPLLEKVAYPTADQIVFVTDIVVNSVLSMARWVHEVTSPKEAGGMGIPKGKIGIVVNKALAQVSMSGEKIVKSAQGIGIVTAIPSNPKIIAHAANMSAMEVLLKHPDLVPAIERLAWAVVGNKYKLSKNVEA